MLRKLMVAIALVLGVVALSFTPKPAQAGGLSIELRIGGGHGWHHGYVHYPHRVYRHHHYRPRVQYHRPYVVYRKPRLVKRYRYVDYRPSCEIRVRKVHRHGHWVKQRVRVCYGY